MQNEADFVLPCSNYSFVFWYLKIWEAINVVKLSQVFCLSFDRMWDCAGRTPETTGWDCLLLILTHGGFQVGRVKKLVPLALLCSRRWGKQRHSWMQNQIWWLLLFKGGTACRNSSLQGNMCWNTLITLRNLAPNAYGDIFTSLQIYSLEKSIFRREYDRQS